MGSYVFKWPRPASEVYVTGTFDDWGKSVKLDNHGASFSKEVTLDKVDKKIYYKFVVDGTWTTDHGQSQEDDGSGNINNVLTPSDFKPTKMERDSSTPGAFPETPANETSEFSVKPLPASSGAVNPIQLKPGEKVPEPEGDVNDNVTTSQEDYEKAGGSALGIGAGMAAVASAAAAAKEYMVPEKSKNMIPESSLPVESANPTVQSAGPSSTTAQLAGQVTFEPKQEAKVLDDSAADSGVPEVVKESIAESNQGPEAAANPEAVEEKKEVESELLKEIKQSNATGEPAPTASAGEVGVAGTAASAVPEPVKESITESHQSPEAAGSAEAVKEKSQVEKELLQHVKPSNEVGEPAPTAAAATTETAPAATTGNTAATASDATPSEPTVTTGVNSGKTETTTTPETPAKSTTTDTPETSTPTTPTSAAADEKKKKRKSIFGKLKEKFK